MKKILLVLLLIPSFLGVKAQQDSAIMLVEGFLKFANYDSYVKDSVLYIESEIVKRYGEGDTVRIKRWYCPPNNYRIEVWSGRRPEVAMIGYKDSSFMYYFSSDRSWRHVHVDNFYQREWEYDFRSPLYFWKNNGMELTYEGTLDFEGSEVQQVLVRAPNMFDRHYLFEKKTGLYFMYIEDGTRLDSDSVFTKHPVDWRAVHEYMPFRKGFYPSFESYQADGDIILIHNTLKVIPYKKEIFLDTKL